MGHSTRTIEEFVRLLQAGRVEWVVDVRRIPRSRSNPQYNRETLPQNLAPFKIGYCHIAELGGLRSRPKNVSKDLNGFWINRSFHNYADYALSEDFHRGFEELIRLGRKKVCAVMCSEAVWWRCHRRIIADYLIAHGERVFHLMGAEQVVPAQLTEGARLQSSQEVVYPL